MFYGTVLAQSGSELCYLVNWIPVNTWHRNSTMNVEHWIDSSFHFTYFVLVKRPKTQLHNPYNNNNNKIMLSLWRQWRRMGNVNLFPLNPNVCIRCSEWSYSRSGHFFSRYPLNRREFGHQMRSGRLGENIILVRVPGIEPRALVLILIIKQTGCTNFSNLFSE